MPLPQRNQNLIRNEVAQHQGACQSQCAYRKVLILKPKESGNNHHRREHERDDPVQFDDARATESGPHELQFLLPEPVLSKHRAIGRAQQRIPNVTAQRGHGTTRSGLLLKLLDTPTQGVLPRAQVVVHSCDEQCRRKRNAQEKQKWKV